MRRVLVRHVEVAEDEVADVSGKAIMTPDSDTWPQVVLPAKVIVTVSVRLISPSIRRTSPRDIRRAKERQARRV